MNHPYTYVGCFVDKDELEEKLQHTVRTKLWRTIEAPHVTFEYQPREVDEELFGEKVQIRMTGYGCDGQNEGVKVELFSANPKIAEMIQKIPVPHITLSVSACGKPVDTRDLRFEPMEPVEIVGIYGAYTNRNTVAFVRG